MSDVASITIQRDEGESGRMESFAILGTLGLAQFLLTGVALRLHDAIDWNVFVLLILVSGAVALAATRVASRCPAGQGLAAILGFALALRLIALSYQPILSDDVYRYVWDGLVQGAGINPYRHVPSDPALAYLRDADVFPNINRADYAATIYPPVAQFFFFAVTRIGASITAMRLALIGCEALTVIVLIDLLRRIRKPVTLVVAYAWHPLAVWEVANSGHVEALMATLVIVGTWFAIRHRRLAAAVAITLGSLVKPYAIATLPACWRPFDWRLPATVILVVVACYLPYLSAGTTVFGFLFGGYLQEEGLATGEGFWLVRSLRMMLGDIPGLVPLYLLLAAVTLSALGLRAAFVSDVSPQRITQDIATLVLAGLFFLSPNYPWYFLVAAALIPIGGGAPAWALSLGAILLYLLYPDYDARFVLWKGIASAAFLIAIVISAIRDRSGRMAGAFSWTR
jgi:hypothetical protein